MLQFLEVDCAMAQAIREHDWADHPLGAPEDWPNTLKTTVGLILGSRFPQCIVWGEGLSTIPNDAFLPILGNKPRALGRRFDEVWSEVWEEIAPIARRAMRGEPTYIEDFALTVERGGSPEQAWFTFCYSPIRDAFGEVVGMLDTVVETTETVRTRRQVQIANRELAHRIKNMLGVLQAVARQTFRGDNATPEARQRFDRRLAALGEAQDLLLRSEFSAANVADIIRTALAPHLPDPQAARLDGPHVQLGGRLVLSLALAVHELATNAVKYGALSAPQGRVAVRWSAGAPDSDDPFHLEWCERDGPEVAEPRRSGFGSHLITRVLAADFQGEAELRYPADGVRFELRTAMRHLGGE